LRGQAIYAEGKVGGVRYTDGSGSWYIAGWESQRDEGVLYSYMNNAEGFPQNSEIDLETIVAAAKDFLASGGNRPVGVEWIEWPPDQV
jgi:hypothetical protein